MEPTQNNNTPRAPYWWEIRQLEAQGCKASDWENVLFHEDTDFSLLRNVEFRGQVTVGLLKSGEGRECGLANALIIDTQIGDLPLIRNIAGKIENAIIGDRVTITGVGSIVFEPESKCGMGTEVNVLDETGSMPVRLYPGLSAQTAMLMARKPRWCENHIKPILDDKFDFMEVSPRIGDDVEIYDTKYMLNVAVGNEVKIEGASRLINGMVINNSGMKGRCLAYIGADVDAENFMVEDGVLDGGSYVRNSYIGQGAVLDKRFTAHDSLFFANCACENGEACAVFAGPYTVTMHKATLLIGAVTSFMNAGSGTNQSNHMYKLGPVHWGIMERGVKTSSESYIMWGAKIGAFSLLMGAHKNHPDSSEFPFSYIFGDAKGATTVVPALMLRSCGLLRDEMKWPTRDRRQKRKLPLHDRINFTVLNPYTVGKMLEAIKTINELHGKPADDDLFIRYKGMKFRGAALDRAHYLYTLAILKYLYMKLGDATEFPARTSEAEEWVDLSGQLMPRSVMERAKNADSVEEMEEIFDKAFEDTERLELEWIANRFDDDWRRRLPEARFAASTFDRMIDDDRTSYRESLDAETAMLEL